MVERTNTVWTVLGSCVAVILHVPRLRISAVCHAQMPERDDPDSKCFESCPEPCHLGRSDTSDLKYVTCCIRYMVDELLRRGVLPGEIVATLVGGANVLPVITPSRSPGERNVAMAQTMLEREGIRIRWVDTGGRRGRTIEHSPASNRTVVRHHHRTT